MTTPPSASEGYSFRNARASGADPFTTPDSLTRRLRTHPRDGNNISRGFLAFALLLCGRPQTRAPHLGSYASVSGAWTEG